MDTVIYHTEPKAQESVRQPSLERKDEAARERSSDWYCFGSDRQCLLRLCCALRIVLTRHSTFGVGQAWKSVEAWHARRIIGVHWRGSHANLREIMACKYVAFMALKS